MPMDTATLELSLQTQLLDLAVQEIQSDGALTAKAIASTLMAMR